MSGIAHAMVECWPSRNAIGPERPGAGRTRRLARPAIRVAGKAREADMRPALRLGARARALGTGTGDRDRGQGPARSGPERPGDGDGDGTGDRRPATGTATLAAMGMRPGARPQAAA